MKNKFKKWDRVNLYNPRVSSYGKKQFIVVSDKPIEKVVSVQGCLSNPTGIKPQMAEHYAIMLNEKIKWIPEYELRVAEPYFRVGDRVLLKKSNDGDIYTLVRFDKQTGKLLLKYANGEIEADPSDIELIVDKWVEYCEQKYKDIVIPVFGRVEKQRVIEKQNLLKRLSGIFGKKNKKENEGLADGNR